MADKPLSETTTQDPNQPEQHSQPESRSQPVQEPALQNGNAQATTLHSGEHGDVLNGVANASSDRATSSASASAGRVSPSPAQPLSPPSVDTAVMTAQASQPTVKEKADEAESSKDVEKDRTSVNTSTHTHTRTQSTRRKEDKKSSSELAHTASTSAVAEGQQQQQQVRKPKSKRATNKKAKPSLFSKLFHALVPCISPSSKYAHAIDVDIQSPAAKDSVPSPPDMKEKPLVKELESKPAEQPSPPPKDPVAEQPTVPQQITPVPAPLQPVDIPPPSDDPAVVVPPTPTKTLPPEETAGLTSGAVQPPGSKGPTKREDSLHEVHRQGDSENESDASTSFTDDEEGEDGTHMDEVEDEEERLIANGGAGIPIGPDGVPRPLLPPLSAKHAGRKCLVLDLDETLVHSSFKSIQQADYVVPVEIEYHWHNVYVIKRPGVDNFLKKMGEIYEVVVFTASLSKYADPVLDKLDIHRVVSHRLFRESCYNHRGNYVKDLSQLGRPISDTIIIDNSPASYIFHPNNAVPVSSWFNDPHDTELTDLVPFLADLAQVDDVRGVLDGGL